MTNGSWVIDASVVAKLYLRDEEFADVAQRMVRGFVNGELDLVAPTFILYEIPSAIQAAVRRERLSSSDGREAVRDFFGLNLRTVGGADRRLVESAYFRAEQLGCRIYDALYLVVAEVFGYNLITADRKLYNGLHQQLDYLIWIGDYKPSTQPSP